MTFPRPAFECGAGSFTVGLALPGADGADSFQVGFRHRHFWWRILIGRVPAFEAGRWLDGSPKTLGPVFGHGLGRLPGGAK